jgi:uncharacterized protein YdaL
MKDIKSKTRRELILGTGAILANASLLGRAARAATGKSGLRGRVRARQRASIIQDMNNPFFIAQGSANVARASASLAAASGAMTGGASAAMRSASLAAASLALTGGALTRGGLTRGALAGGALALGALTQSAPVSAAAAGPSTLVLYDTTGAYGWLGEIYAIMAANLVSHFGKWTALPVVSYTSGMLNNYTACVYIGSTYGEPIPAAFLTDVPTTTANVIWIYDNIWQLTGSYSGFTTQYGFAPWTFDYSTVATVTYKGQSLKRYSANAAGIMNYSPSVPASVDVLALAVRSDTSTFPWAVRQSNLTYIGENPFEFISEGDRYLIFCDLLFDALAPSTSTRHRALVRLEDIDPTFDAATLKSVANYLYSRNVPFGFQIIARYLDPNGYYNNGVAVDTSLHTQTAVVSAINYLEQHGGTMICHGYTHQYSDATGKGVLNPYTGVTGDDCEFYTITENTTNGVLTYVGPLALDNTSPATAWAAGRFADYAAELALCGLTMPKLLTFPAYSASVPDYQAALATFPTRSERSLYFTGLLSGQPINYSQVVGQYFPYSVTDVYGSRVLADTLGGIDPTTFFLIPPRLPADIIADAQRSLVVRDGYASFFYNPEDSISYLKTTIAGIQALGYTFVSPATA